MFPQDGCYRLPDSPPGSPVESLSNSSMDSPRARKSWMDSLSSFPQDAPTLRWSKLHQELRRMQRITDGSLEFKMLADVYHHEAKGNSYAAHARAVNILQRILRARAHVLDRELERPPRLIHRSNAEKQRRIRRTLHSVAFAKKLDRELYYWKDHGTPYCVPLIRAAVLVCLVCGCSYPVGMGAATLFKDLLGIISKGDVRNPVSVDRILTSASIFGWCLSVGLRPFFRWATRDYGLRLTAPVAAICMAASFEFSSFHSAFAGAGLRGVAAAASLEVGMAVAGMSQSTLGATASVCFGSTIGALRMKVLTLVLGVRVLPPVETLMYFQMTYLCLALLSLLVLPGGKDPTAIKATYVGFISECNPRVPCYFCRHCSAGDAIGELSGPQV